MEKKAPMYVLFAGYALVPVLGLAPAGIATAIALYLWSV